MAIELITGVGAEPHISSNDFRAFNRANFGQGRYILKDADDMAITVSAPTGNISIAEGSCLWSGMHIRVSSQENLTYVVPTTAQTVRVYLHYTKNSETQVESVEFVVTVGEELAPIVDNLGDSTVEAYTVFYSFTASSSSITNAIYDFQPAKSHAELETLVDNSHSETILFDGIAAPNTTINLSESFRSFYEIEIISDWEESNYPNLHKRMLTSQLEPSGGVIDVAMLGAAKWANTNDTYLRVATARLNITNDKTLVYSNGQYIIIGNAISEQDDIPIRKIIGIGRKT